MNPLLYISLVALLLVGLGFLNRVLKVENLKLGDWFQVAFAPTGSKKYHVSSMSSLGFVVSKDGKIYKLRLPTTFKNAEVTS